MKNSNNHSRIAFGCMGMSEFYGKSDDNNSLLVLEKAFEAGYTHFDTADMYGKGHNEELIGKFISRIGKNHSKVTIATKGGIRRDPNNNMGVTIDSSPEYIISAVDKSLERLNIESIDLYYLHRRDPDVPINETMDAMKQLKSSGKIKSIGLSEVSSKTIIEANSIVKVDALQSEYSLWSRDVEKEILPTCIDLGIKFYSYSPMGRGFLTGKLTKEIINQEGDLRKNLPRFQDEAFDSNQLLIKKIEGVANKYNATSAQITLAWLLAQNELVHVIPGSRSNNHLLENFESGDISLKSTDVEFLSEVFNLNDIHGLRYPKQLLSTTNV